ncbi:MAG: lytic transglycosylase domain-containing protein [Verrucomicrobiales bacterium]
MNLKTKLGIAFLVAFAIVDLVLIFWWRTSRTTQFDGDIRAAARKYHVDPALIKAVIWQESKFHAEVRGQAGEIGLMQVREDAAFEWAEDERMPLDRFNHEQITDPAMNIQAGTYYLSKLLKRYTKTDNPIPYALADYNAGRTHVLRWKKGPADTNSAAFLAAMDYPGTRKYAVTIMERYQLYKQKFSQ